MNKSSSIIIALLLVIIAILAWLAFGKPAHAPLVGETPVITDTQKQDPNPTPTTQSPAPLHTKIVVTSPKADASVTKKFAISGKAPGNWFFEASAPYMVTTPEGEKIAQGTIQAVGDWMTTSLVDFKGDVSVNPAYSGPAILVLLKDNPSGLPENDDSLEIEITIQ